MHQNKGTQIRANTITHRNQFRESCYCYFRPSQLMYIGSRVPRDTQHLLYKCQVSTECQWSFQGLWAILPTLWTNRGEVGEGEACPCYVSKPSNVSPPTPPRGFCSASTCSRCMKLGNSSDVSLKSWRTISSRSLESTFTRIVWKRFKQIILFINFCS